MAFDQFWLIFNEVYENCFPEKVIWHKKRKKKQEWITKGLIKSRTNLLALRKLYFDFPTTTNKVRYIEFRNLFNKLKRIAKKNYFNSTLQKCSNDLRKTWSILNEIRRKSSNKSISIKNINVGNECISDKTKMANCFNSHFSNIANDVVSSIPPTSVNFESYLDEPCPFKFTFPSVGTDLIMRTVSSMENKWSEDLYGLSTAIIKKLIKSIASPLAYIFTLSFQQGKIPTQLKVSRTIPIFKTGDPCEMNNYRPIGLLAKLSQIQEKIASVGFNAHLENHKLLYRHQYGFRKGHSTIHPIIHLLNEIAKCTSTNELLLAILMDLKKCFDVLDRDILLKKLENLGVDNQSLSWFRDYFEDRCQYTDIEGNLSNKDSPDRGVIQGSILGPLLCSVYLNDMHSASNLMTLLLFADDSSCLFRHNNLVELIKIANAEFAKLCQWMRANKLKLHPDKTNFMIFCNSKKKLDLNICKIFLDDNDIDNFHKNPDLVTQLECLNNLVNPSVRFLGVILDPHLTFRPHVDSLCKKLSQGLFILRNAKNLLSRKSLISLYYTLINSHINYGLQAYGCGEVSSLHRVFKLQKKAVRIIAGKRFNSHTDPIFKELGILKLFDLIEFVKIDFMHSYSKFLLPASFNETWVSAATFNENFYLDLRNYLDYKVPFSRLKFSDRLPLHSYPMLWNNLKDVQLMEENNKKLFKTKLRCRFLEKLPETVRCNNYFCKDCHG